MKKIHKHTVRSRYVMIAVLTAIPLIFICAFLITLAMQQSRDRLANAADTSVRLMASSLNNEMDYEESYMVMNSINNISLRRLGGRVDRTQAYLDLYEMKLTSASLMSTNENLTSYVVCSIENDFFMNQFDSSWGGDPVTTVGFFQQMEEELKKLFGSGPLDAENWFWFRISHHTCLVRVVKYHSVYQACIIDLDILLRNAVELYGLDGKLAIYDMKNELLVGSDKLNFDEIRWNRMDYGTVRVDGENYLAVNKKSNNLQFVYYIKDETYKDSFDIVIIMIMIVAAILVIVYFISWLYLKRTVFSPLDSLVNTMERIKDGDYTFQSKEEYDNEEFKRVNGTFKEMVSEITHLRIDSYEQQLLSERSELAALKMQIRPHFVLNCLKSVYALTETHRIQEVQSLILLLSKHLRYVLSFTDDNITLKQELEMCQNYVELLNVGQNRKATCRILLDEQLQELGIPNVSILTLVENCIKHGWREDHTLEITVTAKYLVMEQGALANITVSDNGLGFGEEQLLSLNQQIPMEKDGHHVGIANVVRRMQLCFGNETAIAFSNSKTGGAVIDLYLSLSNRKGMVTGGETKENDLSDEDFWKSLRDE